MRIYGRHQFFIYFYKKNYYSLDRICMTKHFTYIGVMKRLRKVNFQHTGFKAILILAVYSVQCTVYSRRRQLSCFFLTAVGSNFSDN